MKEAIIATKRLVLGIFRMTIHNGPGLRTLILFKGCPLHCVWCSTPESQKATQEIAFYPDKCNHCSQCIEVCPLKAIKYSDDIICIDRNLCDNCGKCAEVCYAEAIKLLGQPMTVEDLVEEIKKDMTFFRHSHGGVTISGGEPLLNYEFNEKLFKALKDVNINIGIDSCGYVPFRNIEPLLPYIDFFLWDIKHMDPDKHKEFTGVSNKLILENARLLSARNIPLYIRIPVIPGYNDTQENIRATCEFARGLTSLVEVGIIPMHHIGKARYDSLNRLYPLDNIPIIHEDTLQELKALVESYGLPCVIYQ
jgi:pyruvate formate lyase activating enzyme